MKNNNLNFEDIKEGFEDYIVISISNEMIDNYIKLTGDNSAIHTSKTLAIKAGFDNRVMHGGMLLGFYSNIIGTKMPGDTGLILELKSKFNNPVYPGDIININYKIIEKHSSVSCITIRFKSRNQENLVVGTSLVNVKVRTWIKKLY